MTREKDNSRYESIDGKSINETGTYTVCIYTDESQLIGEYEIDGEDEGVSCIEDAEEKALENLGKSNYGTVVLVVSEEIEQAFNQVHKRVVRDCDRAA